MVQNKWKAFKLLILVILVVTLSVMFKIMVTDTMSGDLQNLPDYAKTRKIVELWTRNTYYWPQIDEQVDNYNISNKDNIYINLISYSGDYTNMLRMKLQTSNKPDIFEIGTYNIMRDGKLYPLDTYGINQNTISRNKLLMFKNKPVGVNISGNAVKFVWNKDIFKKCGLDPNKGPTTWAEVMEYSKIIKSKMPNVVPFEAPFSGYQEFRRSIGEPSVNSDTIHTTFWNYKKGAYDYSSSKYILNFYREMYKDNLMSRELEKMDRDRVRKDFYLKQTAMFISFYDDKINFLTRFPIDFNVGISNLPKINITDKQNYYFIDDTSRIAVNSTSGDKPEVKKVFKWLANMELDSSKVTLYKYKSKYFPQYSGYDNVSNFRFEDKDPTPALNFGQKKINDLIYNCIRSEKSTDSVISDLNKYLNDYCKDIKSTDKNFFNSFIGKE